jgi:GMP synthase (glutamine-hydrolysing)
MTYLSTHPNFPVKSPKVATVLVLQHIACETLGTIEAELRACRIEVKYVRPYAGEPVPTSIGNHSGLIVMGGPMGVAESDRFPFLSDEMRLIEDALRCGKPLLGICLGSQLIAASLGANVARASRPEIGWFPISLTEEASSDRLWRGVSTPFTGLHWHGDVFELPAGATSLAYSGDTPCQAFRHGHNTYAFQFHMEVTEQILADLIEAFPEELAFARVDGAQLASIAKVLLPQLRRIGTTVFSRWSRLVVQPR